MMANQSAQLRQADARIAELEEKCTLLALDAVMTEIRGERDEEESGKRIAELEAELEIAIQQRSDAASQRNDLVEELDTLEARSDLAEEADALKTENAKLRKMLEYLLYKFEHWDSFQLPARNDFLDNSPARIRVALAPRNTETDSRDTTQKKSQTQGYIDIILTEDMEWDHGLQD